MSGLPGHQNMAFRSAKLFYRADHTVVVDKSRISLIDIARHCYSAIFFAALRVAQLRVQAQKSPSLHTSRDSY
jgi:hypothetical protein